MTLHYDSFYFPAISEPGVIGSYTFNSPDWFIFLYDCTDDSYTKIKLCCGEGTDTYRYIDVNRNVFADGLTGYSQTGLILESKDQDGNDFSVQNIIYATSSHPHNLRSWWGGGAGCNESSTNLTINNYCQMEAANCFGQNIGNGNNRYLWVYVQ